MGASVFVITFEWYTCSCRFLLPFFHFLIPTFLSSRCLQVFIIRELRIITVGLVTAKVEVSFRTANCYMFRTTFSMIDSSDFSGAFYDHFTKKIFNRHSDKKILIFYYVPGNYINVKIKQSSGIPFY